MKNEYLINIFKQIEQVSENAKKDFGNLNYEELNRKPHPKSWSVAQCFDHLINTNKAYEARINQIIQNQYQPNFWERRAWFTSLFKNILMSATAPQGGKKTKTFPVFEPAMSDISETIIEDFRASNEKFIKLLRRTDKLDHPNYIISSPVSNFVVYSLETMCTILGNHQERHFNQAKRLLYEY